eukprot:4282944-Amphidinium_carterae.1
MAPRESVTEEEFTVTVNKKRVKTTVTIEHWLSEDAPSPWHTCRRRGNTKENKERAFSWHTCRRKAYSADTHTEVPGTHAGNTATQHLRIPRGTCLCLWRE